MLSSETRMELILSTKKKH